MLLTLCFFSGCDACPILNTDTLADAGCNESDLPLAKVLRQEGAPWPQQLANADNDCCWCAAAVAWARAEGCTAPVLTFDAEETDSDIDDDF
jgi:hypothetical protein